MFSIRRTIYQVQGEPVTLAFVADQHPKLIDAAPPPPEPKPLAVERPPSWSEKLIRRSLGRDREHTARLLNRIGLRGDGAPDRARGREHRRVSSGFWYFEALVILAVTARSCGLRVRPESLGWITEFSEQNASALRLRFSQSLASRRQRLSQAMVRSTIQRFGTTTNPATRSERLTIATSREGRIFASVLANCGP